MLIEFKNLNEDIIKNFKGGEREFIIRQFNDQYNKIAIGKLESGASVGLHTHTDSCEIIYVISGSGTATHNGTTEKLYPGVCHYCPKGDSHSIFNDSNEPLVFFLSVNKQ